MGLKKIIVTVPLISLCLISGVFGSETQKYFPETDPAVLKKLQSWQDMKFGLLMHWGPYSQWGVVESWSICPEDEPWCQRKSDSFWDYKKDYENLKTTFNPARFNPNRWAQAAKEAGMRYVVFTTKPVSYTHLRAHET